jgi:hypothetical protein
MSIPLIVVPNSAALSRENGLYAQEPIHFAGFENPSLGIDQRDPLAFELEASGKITRFEHATPSRGGTSHVVKSSLPEVSVAGGLIHGLPVANREPRDDGSQDRKPG